MIRILRNFYVLVCLMLVVGNLYAQDFFDYRHSIDYVNDLIQKKEYEFAYTELVRLDSQERYSNDTVTILLLKVCYFSGSKAEMTVRIDSLNTREKISTGLIECMTGLCLTVDSFRQADQIMNSHAEQLTPLLHQYRMVSLLLQNKYAQGQTYYDKHKHELNDTVFYAEQLDKKQKSKAKSKTLAVVMSTIVPASGKYYLGDYYDATVGLSLTSLYGILCIRAFNIAGSGSVFGWVNLAAFTTFYVGNIIGTAKAADRYNNKINNSIKSELKNKLHTLSGI